SGMKGCAARPAEGFGEYPARAQIRLGVGASAPPLAREHEPAGAWVSLESAAFYVPERLARREPTKLKLLRNPFLPRLSAPPNDEPSERGRNAAIVDHEVLNEQRIDLTHT